MRKLTFLMIAAIALCGFASADTNYSNAASFSAAAGTTNTANFSDVTSTNAYFGPTSVDGITLAPTNGTLFLVDPGFSYGAEVGNGYAETQGNAGLSITLPYAVNAFGLNLGDFWGNTNTNGNVNPNFTITLGNGSVFNVSLQGNYTLASTFFGVTSSNPFTTVDIQGGDPFPTYDNIQYSAQSTTPEPASLILLGSGLVAVGSRLRRFVA